MQTLNTFEDISGNQTALDSEDGTAALFLLEQTMGFTYQGALRVACVLNIADHLANGSMTVHELARVVPCDAVKLHRVLRLLATRDVFKETDVGRFELTPPAQFLRSDVPLSLKSAVLMLTDESLWRPAGDLAPSVLGGCAFRNIFGTSFWEHWAQRKKPSEDFHVGMSSMSDVENLFLVRKYDFPPNAVVADIAGGFGGLLLRVLRENPTVRGILFDQANVLARHRLNELDDDERWVLEEGDFFAAVPSADIYLLKYIMHDWSDEKAGTILRRCREAMKPGGRVLILDPVIPEGNQPHGGKLLDIICMCAYEGGRERTRKEFEELLGSAGLKLARIIDTGSYISIVEAIAA